MSSIDLEGEDIYSSVLNGAVAVAPSTTPSKQKTKEKATKEKGKRKKPEPSPDDDEEEEEGDEDDEPEAKKQVIEDPQAKRRRLIMNIRAYKQNFPSKLPDDLLDIEDIGSMSIKQLEKTLSDIQWVLDTSTSTAMVKATAEAGLGLYEKGCIKLGYQVHGLGNQLSQSDAWNDLLKELELRWIGCQSVPAEVRALFYLAAATHTVHTTNVDSIQRQRIKQCIIPKDIDDKYKDLF